MVESLNANSIRYLRNLLIVFKRYENMVVGGHLDILGNVWRLVTMVTMVTLVTKLPFYCNYIFGYILDQKLRYLKCNIFCLILNIFSITLTSI